MNKGSRESLNDSMRLGCNPKARQIHNMYDHRVFDYCRDLRPSERGELEITDVNNAYITAGDLYFDVLQGWWTDAGQFESLYHAAQLVARQRLGELPRTPA